jgi:hypothetical protein
MFMWNITILAASTAFSAGVFWGIRTFLHKGLGWDTNKSENVVSATHAAGAVGAGIALMGDFSANHGITCMRELPNVPVPTWFLAGSMGYFLADGIDCAIKKNWAHVLHHLVGVSLALFMPYMYMYSLLFGEITNIPTYMTYHSIKTLGRKHPTTYGCMLLQSATWLGVRAVFLPWIFWKSIQAGMWDSHGVLVWLVGGVVVAGIQWTYKIVHGTIHRKTTTYEVDG